MSAAAGRRKTLDIVLEFLRAVAGHGVYSSTGDELLPVRLDFKCLVWFDVRSYIGPEPGLAIALSAGSIASYSFSPTGARRIADLSGGPMRRRRGAVADTNEPLMRRYSIKPLVFVAPVSVA